MLSVPGALWTYWRSVRTRRAEWLASLHEQFFETDRYANVRRILDYDEQPGLQLLSDAVEHGTHHPLADEFYRYLNFFEHLAALHQLGQGEEITALFEYDLRLIQKHAFVRQCLRPQGFERLPMLLERLRLVMGQ